MKVQAITRDGAGGAKLVGAAVNVVVGVPYNMAVVAVLMVWY